MSDQSGKSRDDPKVLNECARANIRHAKNACNEILSMAQNNVALMEWRASAGQSGARDAWKRVFAFTDQHVTTSCDFAQRLLYAKTACDLVALQVAFVQSQVRILVQGATEFAGAMAKTANNAGNPR